jgi:hypothetical protein
MTKFYARICWDGWVFPLGDAKELGTASYVTQAGLRHEEWPFNFSLRRQSGIDSWT